MSSSARARGGRLDDEGCEVVVACPLLHARTKRREERAAEFPLGERGFVVFRAYACQRAHGLRAEPQLEFLGEVPAVEDGEEAALVLDTVRPCRGGNEDVVELVDVLCGVVIEEGGMSAGGIAVQDAARCQSCKAVGVVLGFSWLEGRQRVDVGQRAL